MSSYTVQPNRVAELRSFQSDLNRYYGILHRSMSGEKLPKAIDTEGTELLFDLNHQVGSFGQLITELTGLTTVNVHGSEADMWVVALKIPPDKLAFSALGRCVQVTTRAIGQLENDIKTGIRDRKTGKMISPIGESKLEIKTKPTSKREPKDTDESLLYLFDSMQFHPRIVQASRKLFEDGHYSDAILRAFIEVNSFVKAKTGLELDGKALMSKVFRIDEPVIKLNKLKTQSEKDEQEGFMFLFMGAMVGIRNPKAHDNIIQRNPLRTLEYLALASMLMRRAE